MEDISHSAILNVAESISPSESEGISCDSGNESSEPAQVGIGKYSMKVHRIQESDSIKTSGSA